MLNVKQCCPDESARKLSRKRDFKEELAVLAKALAHPVRVQILTILKSRKTCICGEIVEELPLAQATVSQHLKVLKNAGLIRGEISGPSTCYCLEPTMLRHLKQLVKIL